MAHISQKDWENLTDREKELLKSIGIKPNGKHKAPPGRPSSTKAPDPYTLEITVHCQLCGGTPVSYFSMELSEENGSPHLRAVPICKEDALKKTTLTKRDSYSSTCSECYQHLQSWRKEDLIRKLIKVFPLASIGAGR